MAWLGLLTLVICVTSSVQGGGSLQCLSCESHAPKGCKTVAKCNNNNQVCAAHVVNIRGHFIYRYQCQDAQACPSARAALLIGKRNGDAVTECHQCCADGHKCNENLCVKHVCSTCQGIRDPAHCHSHTLCQNDEVCFTEVKNVAGTYLYFMSCQKSKACPASGLMGKRSVRGAPHFLPSHCSGCCIKDKDCSKHLCPGYKDATPMQPPPVHVSINIPSTTQSVAATTAAATTAAVPKTTTPVYDPNCRDLEEDGVTCASLDAFNFCTDPDVFAYVLSHKKCRKHCGVCMPPPNVPVVPVVMPPAGTCEDKEQDGITCVELDLFDICNGGTSLKYVVARQKCFKHCGLCQPSAGNQVIIPSIVTTATSTVPPTVTSTVAASHVQAQTLYPCVDIEDSTFNCTVWESKGYCNPIPGSGYETAKLRCRKKCGFCRTRAK